MNGSTIFKAAVAVLFMVVGSQAWAQHVAGIKATVTNTNQITRTVDINVTEYADYTYTFGTMWIGLNTSYYGGTIPGVEWGDGDYEPFTYSGLPRVATSTSISGLMVNVYRGSFSHTYGSDGNYTVQVNSTSGPGYPGSTYYDVITGNYTWTFSTDYGTVAFLTNTVAVAISGLMELSPVPAISRLGMVIMIFLFGLTGLILFRRGQVNS